MRVKTRMGLERFEVRFFFWQNCTKFVLTLEIVIRNPSKVVYRIFVMFSTIWQKNFFCTKSHMGTPLEWFFFTLNKKNTFTLLLGQTRVQKKYRSKLDIRYLAPVCFSSWTFLTRIKNPMGLKRSFWMESLFVGQKKVAKLLKSCRKYLYDVFNDMTEDFFWQKSYGNTIRMKFFYTIFFQLQVQPYLAVQIKKKSVWSKTFLYDSLEKK